MSRAVQSRDEDAFLAWNPDWTERFDDRIRRTEDHWLWTGYIHPKDGYGRFKPYHHGSPMLAHRVAYVRWVGPIPEDRPVIDHLGHPFKLRHCLRPQCLEAISYEENTRRGNSPAGKNARLTACPRCGTEYTPESTFTRPDGERRCRICRRQEQARWRARKAAAR